MTFSGRLPRSISCMAESSSGVGVLAGLRGCTLGTRNSYPACAAFCAAMRMAVTTGTASMILSRGSSSKGRISPISSLRPISLRVASAMSTTARLFWRIASSAPVRMSSTRCQAMMAATMTGPTSATMRIFHFRLRSRNIAPPRDDETMRAGCFRRASRGPSAIRNHCQQAWRRHSPQASCKSLFPWVLIGRLPTQTLVGGKDFT